MTPTKQYERRLRRFAVPLFADLSTVPYGDALATVRGALAMLEERLDGRPSADAAALYARLPDDTQDARRVLHLLASWLRYLETGLTDISVARSLGTTFIEGSAQGLNELLLAPSLSDEEPTRPALQIVSG